MQTDDDGPAGGRVLDADELAAEVRGLRLALTTPAPIEQAKGLVMLRYGLDPDSAFTLLARWSSRLNVTLHRIAEALVLGAQHGDLSGSDPVVQAHVLDVCRGTRQVTSSSE